MTNQKFEEFASQGRVSFGPGAQAIIEQIAGETAKRHPTYPRICLSCGAREALDGSLPCGH